MNIMTISILFFASILLAAIAVYSTYIAVKTSPGYEIRKRLRKMAINDVRAIPEELSIEILKEMPHIDRFFYKFGLIKRLDGLIDRAGLKVDVKMFVLVIAVFAMAGLAVGLALPGREMLALVLSPLCGAAPLLYVRSKMNKRARQFMEQFPSALDMIARSLKAGHAFSSAVQIVGSEMSEPLAGLFKTAYEEQTLGLSMKDALAHMSERVDSTDFKFFVTAVNIHREIGGNLSEILERLAKTIRERITIRRQVKVYTAQARLSGYILAALPIFMAVFLYFIAPDYIGELVSEDAGKYAIAAAAGAQVLGFIFIKKIINIRI